MPRAAAGRPPAAAAGAGSSSAGVGVAGGPPIADTQADMDPGEADAELRTDAAEPQAEAPPTDGADGRRGSGATAHVADTGMGADTAAAPGHPGLADEELPAGAGGDSAPADATPSLAAAPPSGAPTDADAVAREQAREDDRRAQADSEQAARQATASHAAEQAASDAQAGRGLGDADAGDVTLAGTERDAALGALGEELPAGGGTPAGGGGGGGGGAAETPADAAPPDVAGLPPEQGLAALAGATPAQAEAGLGGVAVSAAADAAAQTAEVQAGLPGATLGEPAATRRAAPRSAAPAATTPKPAAAGPAPKTQVRATPEAPRGNAADRVPRPEIPTPAEGQEPSPAQRAQLSRAISALPASDPGLNLRLGDAPQLALAGAADPAQMAAQQARSAQAVQRARQQDAAEVARPLGEQDVRPTVGIATVQARPIRPAGGGGAGASAGASTVAGGGSPGGVAGGSAGGAGGDKARALLAEELHGPQVRAAMAAASARAAAAKSEAQARAAAGGAAALARIGELKSQAVADQDAARAKVRADAAAARSGHAARQAAAVGRLERTQQATLARAGTQVAERKRQGDEAAAAQIAEGDRQVAGKQAEVESQVEGKKAEVRQASEERGFFGRLADSVGAWFDRAKQWISEKVEAGKRWIRETADRFKRYAAEKIDAARDAVTGLIRDAGAALVAVSDAVLSEFPAARDAVRGAIESGVEWGVQKTNQVAERAKAAVEKAVDTAAAVAEGALDIGGKAVNAALDGARATAVGALNAADKVAQALGVLKVLVEDVATGPAAWIGKLGASARDGVVNHLASAMKAAIRQWWEGKLESVLGVGPAIWALLKQGGLGLKEIGAMAWSAIKAAIPPALVRLVIEKLVAMIVPAAGAVLAVIEGLQAAWGSVSAILGAVGRAIAFLKAVKGGGAGPQFAQLVAAAAVVVIDFVSHWLLQRLNKAIGRIAGRVKGIAAAVRRKVGAAVRRARARGKAGRRAGATKKGRPRAGDPRAARKDDAPARRAARDAARRDRLARAVAAIEPALRRLVAAGVGKARLWLQVQGWRLRHRLTQLRVLTGGGQLRLQATVNPSETFGSGLVFEGARLSVLIRQIVREELLSRPEVAQRAAAAPGAQSVIASPADLAGQAMQTRAQFAQHGPGGLFNYKDWRQHTVHYQAAGGGPGHTVTEGRALFGGTGAPMERIAVPGSSGSYPHLGGTALPELMARTGMSDAQLGRQLGGFAQTGQLAPQGPGGRPIGLDDARMMAATAHLLFVGESARSAGNLVLAPMTAQLTEQGALRWHQALAPRQSPALHLPMALAGAPSAARGLEQRLQAETGIAPRAGPQGTLARAGQMAASEENLVIAWVQQVAGGQVAAGSEESIRALVRRFVRDWYRLHSPSRPR